MCAAAADEAASVAGMDAGVLAAFLVLLRAARGVMMDK